MVLPTANGDILVNDSESNFVLRLKPNVGGGCLTDVQICSAGEEDVFTFTGSIGQRLLFDALDSIPDGTSVRLTSPTGQAVSAQHRVLRNTYLLLALSMVPTGIGALLGVAYAFERRLISKPPRLLLRPRRSIDQQGAEARYRADDQRQGGGRVGY